MTGSRGQKATLDDGCSVSQIQTDEGSQRQSVAHSVLERQAGSQQHQGITHVMPEHQVEYTCETEQQAKVCIEFM